MNRRSIKLTFLVCAMLIASVVMAQTAPSTRPGARNDSRRNPKEYAERFAVIAERNMFVRERRAPVGPATRTTQPVRPPITPEAATVLRGVVFEDTEYRAYFEDTRTNQMLRLSPGETLLRGRIAEISIDAAAFETERGVLWVNIGDNLQGTRVSSAGRGSSGSAASTGGTDATAATGTPTTGAATSDAPPANMSDVEARMRARAAARGRGGS